MDVLGIDHVQLAMPAGGEPQARAFYAGVLGLPEDPKPDALRARGGCWFRTASAGIHLGVDPGFRPARRAHPGLRVADLQACMEALSAAGVEVRRDESVPALRRCYADDPFGNRLEFVEAP